MKKINLEKKDRLACKCNPSFVDINSEPMMSHRSVLWKLKTFLLGNGEHSAKVNAHRTVYKVS